MHLSMSQNVVNVIVVHHFQQSIQRSNVIVESPMNDVYVKVKRLMLRRSL